MGWETDLQVQGSELLVQGFTLKICYTESNLDMNIGLRTNCAQVPQIVVSR